MTTLATNAILRAYRAQHRQESEAPAEGDNEALERRAATPTRSASEASEQDGFEDIVVSQPAVVQQQQQQITSPAPPRPAVPSSGAAVDSEAESAVASGKDDSKGGDATRARAAGSTLTGKVMAALRKATQQEAVAAAAVAMSAADDVPDRLPHPSGEDTGATPQDMTPSLPHSARNESHLLTNVSLSEMTNVDEGAVAALGEVRAATPQPRHAALDERAKAYTADEANTQDVTASAVVVTTAASEAAAAPVTKSDALAPPPAATTPATAGATLNGKTVDDAESSSPAAALVVAHDEVEDARASSAAASSHGLQEGQTPNKAASVVATSLRSAASRTNTPGFVPVAFWQAVVSLRANTNMKSSQDGDSSSAHTTPKRGGGAALLRVLSQCTGIGGQHIAGKRTGGGGSAGLQGGAADSDRGFIDVLKRLPLDRGNALHRRLLYTVYHLLLHPTPSLPVWTARRHHEPSRRGSAVARVEASSEDDAVPARPCPDGTRWSLIGFQGSDPATDLRSTGLVGLLHVLYMLDYYPGLATRLWELCSTLPPADELPAADPTARRGSSSAGTSRRQSGTATTMGTLDLPYILVCFNLTALSMDAMAKGLLTRRASRRRTASGTRDKPAQRQRRSTGGTTSKTATQTGYCAPSMSEAAHAASFPTMMASSEYFVGCVAMFCDMWQGFRQSRSASSQPSVADFGPVKDILRHRVLSHKGAELAFRAADALKRS